MVYINDQKFSCESCIKGHRSSSCTHNDRPLFEVKKKGRPVSQCEKCRHLRKTKRVHSKCICPTEKPETLMKPLCPKSSTKRYIPILPALPNGLKDAFANTKNAPLLPADPRARVDNLLNPCHCKDLLNCFCEAVESGPVASCSRSVNCSGLDTLAQAAASLCCGASSAEQTLDRDSESPFILAQKHKRDSPKPSPKSKHKRLRRRSPTKPTSSVEHERGPVLPPILSDTLSLSTTTSSPPTFPDIPPISSMVSLAGTGCTCGFDCSCPGCLEHRGPEHVEHEHGDCPDNCSTCIDNQHGLELPTATPFGCVPPAPSTNTPDFLAAFFAKAATIPPPPPERAFTRTLDGSARDVTVYPASLFSGESSTRDERGRAFGLVRLPKLECCAGQCGCPGDSCGCGDSCNGCCGDHNNAVPSPYNTKAVVEEIASPPPPAAQEVRSCCAGKDKGKGK